jgi:hypothetical protein
MAAWKQTLRFCGRLRVTNEKPLHVRLCRTKQFSWTHCYGDSVTDKNLPARAVPVKIAGALQMFWLVVACSNDIATTPVAELDASRVMLIAPFISGEYFCDGAVSNINVVSDDEAASYCASIGESAGDRVGAFLDTLGSKTSPSGRFLLGYTHNMPLLRYVKQVNGQFTVDKELIASTLQVINDVDRPVVIFLSSDHFTDSNVPVALQLAANTQNLMWNRDGPLAPDFYFGNPLIAWTLSDKIAPISIIRHQVLTAAIDAICKLPTSAQAKIVAVSILGETHELFPNFQAGPSFSIPSYDATDYSPVAVNSFRNWLMQYFGTISALNEYLGGAFASFESVNPPSKNILTEPYATFFDEIDPYATGIVPIYGWIYDKLGRELKVLVFLDGAIVGVAEGGLNRTDVPESNPSITDQNVGFRLDLDYRNIAYGVHTLEVLVSAEGQSPVQLAMRPLVILSRQLSAPPIVPYVATGAQPVSTDPNLVGFLDGPPPLQSLIYNPLAALWLQYRNHVVRSYIEDYAQLAANSCLPRAKIFSHQIPPLLNGSWNSDLFAADASNQRDAQYSPGVSLYGGAAYGSAFLRMKQNLRWTQYSVGEMHPQIPLAPDTYIQMFNMHRLNGAVFVAPYFTSILPARLSGPGGIAFFAITPDNPLGGSDLYWDSIQAIMRQ